MAVIIEKKKNELKYPLIECFHEYCQIIWQNIICQKYDVVQDLIDKKSSNFGNL